jgi:hypothetical protein
MVVTYNSVGGHRAISYAGALLLGPDPALFGTAISSMDIYCHIDDPDPPRTNQRPLLTRYCARVNTMPSATFYRKPKRIELAFHSVLRPKKSLIRYDPRPASRADVPLVRTIYREIATALEILRRKIKGSDGFDVETFLSKVRANVVALDDSSTQDILDRLGVLRSAERQRVAANQAVK